MSSEDGLLGAPPVRVVAGAERHATIDRSLRLLGFGNRVVEPVAADANGAIDVARSAQGPVVGAGRPHPGLPAGRQREHRCLRRPPRGHRTSSASTAAGCTWTAPSGSGPRPTRPPAIWSTASKLADSWATDGHKWLNVPYDSGFVFCAHPAEHAAAASYTAAYLVGSGGGASPSDFVLESSRRARGFAAWAALRELGGDGVAELVDRCCALARRFAERLTAGGAEVVNDVVLNQVLVGFGSDARTDAVIDGVQRDGTCWLGGTSWRGRRLMRISVSN